MTIYDGIEGARKSWAAARARCNTKSNASYHRYGGRGIKFCEEWDNFQVFLDELGPRPKGYSLDRLDSKQDYKPGNCRWATPTQQSQNQEKVIFVTVDGRTECMREWSRILDVKPFALRSRAKKIGKEEAIRWYMENSKRTHSAPITFNGLTLTKLDWSRLLRIPTTTFKSWLNRYPNQEQALADLWEKRQVDA